MSLELSRLRDLGERRLVREVLADFVPDVGADAVQIDLSRPGCVVSTDPAPRPAAFEFDADYYWWGWLLATINASDLAASCAKPMAFVASLEFPSDMTVLDLRRLLGGIRSSCETQGLVYVGGNIREADRVALHGTAIGEVSGPRSVTRRGAKAGDILLSIGIGGVFWSHYHAAKSGERISRESSPLFSPVSQVNIMFKLGEAGCVSCCMDNSDGLIPTAEELARQNSLTVVVDVDAIRDLGSDKADPRWWLGWGDWNVLAAVPSSGLERVRGLVRDHGGQCVQIGRFENGAPKVILSSAAGRMSAGRLESERFSEDSWFREGVGRYAAMLREYVLP